MILTQENYHSAEARQLWLSASAVKQAKRCEANWYAHHTGKIVEDENKEAFKAGHYFETLLTGTDDDIALFQSQNPDLFSSRGATKGELKSAYQNITTCVEAVKKQPFLMDIIRRSEKQRILTGVIEGVPVRIMMDLLDTDGSVYDLKCMKDFDAIWNPVEECKEAWFQYWDYPMQLWIYREICRQNGIFVPRVGLIASAKSNAGIDAITFCSETMDAAGADARYTIGRMRDIKNGMALPIECEKCSWCVSRQIITEFTEV